MTKRDYPGKGKVAIVKTSPETVLEDYARLMELAGFREALPPENDTLLKINISLANLVSGLLDRTLAIRRRH